MKSASPEAYAALESAANEADPSRRAQFLGQAVSCARAQGDNAGLFKLLNALATHYRDLEDSQTAVSLWMEALQAGRRAGGEAAELIPIEGTLAFTLVRLGLPDQAEEYATLAYEHACELPPGAAAARALNALALTQTKLGHYGQARLTYRSVIRQARGVPEARVEVWRACVNRGVCCLDEAEHPDTPAEVGARLRRRLLRLNQLAARLAPDGVNALYGLFNSLEAHIALGQAADAEASLQAYEAVLAGMTPSAETSMFNALALIGHGLLALLRNDVDRASGFMADGVGALEAMGATDDLPRYLDAISEAEEARGHYAEALHTCRRASRIRLSIARAQGQARMRSIEVKQGLDEARRSIQHERESVRLAERQRQVLLVETVRLNEAANTDALTGLGNRRLLDAIETDVAGGQGESIGVALLDLDHFKLINDRFSHAVGDQVLIQVARILRAHCRPQDQLIRLGGEEIALILRGVSPPTAECACERLRHEIESHPWNQLHSGLAVTASIGLVTARTPSRLKSLLDRADGLLYQAKRGGRNRVWVEP